MVTNDILNCNGAEGEEKSNGVGEGEEAMETDERWSCKR